MISTPELATFAAMKDWSVVGPLLGLLIGWGFNQATAWLATQQADKRVLKETLYYLLELHHQLSGVTRVEKSIEAFATCVQKRDPENYASEEARAKLMEQLRPPLRSMLAPMIGERLSNLKDGYSASLLKLASVDPVNAYRLRGSEEALKTVDAIMTALSREVESQLQVTLTTPIVQKQLVYLRKQLEDKSLVDTGEKVLTVLLEIAEKIGGSTHKQLKAELARQKANLKSMEQDVDKMLDQFTQNMPLHLYN